MLEEGGVLAHALGEGCEAEIRDFDLVVLVEKNVLRLQVPVYDLVLVQVGKS